jgi:hypothetical protein
MTCLTSYNFSQLPKMFIPFCTDILAIITIEGTVQRWTGGGQEDLPVVVRKTFLTPNPVILALQSILYLFLLSQDCFHEIFTSEDLRFGLLES